MAGQAGGSSPHLNTDSKATLKQELLEKGHAFSFFQVIRLLRLFAMQPFRTQTPPSELSQTIQIKPNLSLAFPASDVESVQELGDHKDLRFLITANFMGLYGTASPLPTFYTEDLIDEAADDESVSRDFIDILNQRLFAVCLASERNPSGNILLNRTACSVISGFLPNSHTPPWH